MKDQIIAAIAAYLEDQINLVDPGNDRIVVDFGSKNMARFTHTGFCKEIAEEIAAAIAPMVDKNEKWLEQINTEMWQTWGVKNAPFGREEGEKIMKILNEWAK